MSIISAWRAPGKCYRFLQAVELPEFRSWYLNMTGGVDRSKLTPIGLDRLKNGLLCFVYLEDFDGEEPRFTAVCVDLGIHASGSSMNGAREKLEELLATFVQLAVKRGALEAVLNQSPNAGAVALLRRVQRADQIVRRLTPFLSACVKVARLLTAPPAEQYREAVDLPNIMAFA